MAQSPAVITLTVPEGSTTVIDALLARGAAELAESPTEPAVSPPDDPSQVFYLLFLPPNARISPQDSDLVPVKFALDPQRIAAEAERELRAIYAAHGKAGLDQLDASFMLTRIIRTRYEHGLDVTALMPNADSFGTLEFLGAHNVVADALRKAITALEEDIAAAVTTVGRHAVKAGQARLLELRETLHTEAARYVTPETLRYATVQGMLAGSHYVRVAFRGPDMPGLVAALKEVERDRLALERAAAAVNKSSGDRFTALQDFETATRILMGTVELACDEHPVLHRLWNDVRLPGNTHFDRRGNLLTTPEGNERVSDFLLDLGSLLTSTSEANRTLLTDLTPENVWELEALIDMTLDELDQLGETVWAQAARAEIAKAAGETATGRLADIAGIIQLGGVFLAASPPVLLVLSVAALLLGLAAVTEQYLDLKLKDRAASASLDPRQALSTEPSYVGFYIAVALSILDIPGVTDAARALRAARYGRDVNAAAEAFGAVP